MCTTRRVTVTFEIPSGSSGKDIDDLPGTMVEVIADAFAERGLAIANVDVVVAAQRDEQFRVSDRRVPTDSRLMVKDPNILR